MIRQAVGAIVFQHNEFLLVHKVKISNIAEEHTMLKGEWDFPKGGVKHSDDDLASAILRELEEETGSKEFRVIKQFKDKICFVFPKEIQSNLGYEKQETTMFYVEYIGDRTDLHPKDNEISHVEFFETPNLLGVLNHDDTKGFFERILLKNFQ